MPIQVEFTILKDTITPGLEKLRQFPDKMAEVSMDMARLGQRNLRREITKQNLLWTRQLWTLTQAREISKYRSGVFVPLYGVWLDERRRNLFVPFRYKGGRLRSNSSAVRWAQTAPNSPFKGKKLSGGMIVQPHPWIQTPITRTASRFDAVVDKKVKEALK